MHDDLCGHISSICLASGFCGVGLSGGRCSIARRGLCVVVPWDGGGCGRLKGGGSVMETQVGGGWGYGVWAVEELYQDRKR